MASSRSTSIPSDHLIAEIAAFPVASVASFENNVESLQSSLKGSTGRLWRAAESALLGVSAFGVDEVVAARDRVWFFNPGAEEVSVTQYLQNISQRLVITDGYESIPVLRWSTRETRRTDHASGAAARARWRWMTFALPADLIVAAVGSQTPAPDGVREISRTLEQRLSDRGFSELHLHLGAALTFSDLWCSLMGAIATTDLQCRAFRSPGAEMAEGEHLGSWLLRGAIARLVLANYLGFGRTSDGMSDFLNHVGARASHLRLSASGCAVLSSCLAEILHGQLSTISKQAEAQRYAQLRGLYRQLVVSPKFPVPPASLSEIRDLDPVGQVFHESGEGHGAAAEQRFVSASMGYIRANESDRLFSALFWQCVRLRCIFYRHVVQRPMTPGLQWFVRFFGRMRPARMPLWNVLFESAQRISGESKGLKSLEVRKDPGEDNTDLLDLVRRCADAARPSRVPAGAGGSLATAEALSRATVSVEATRGATVPAHGAGETAPPTELGLVLHFVRDRQGGALQGYPRAFGRDSAADPGAYASFSNRHEVPLYRYSGYYRGVRSQAMSLGWLLQHFPWSLEFIRGVDACTDETGVPTWVLVPLFRYVRACGGSASSEILKQFGTAVPPLRSTIHAGEDFVHLLTGLRAIGDAIRFLPLEEGDRIGHAVALGLDAEDWAARSGRLPLARETRLFDLIWEWVFYSGSGLDVSAARRYSLEKEVADLSDIIFQEQHSMLELRHLVEDLHDDAALRRIGFPSRRLDDRQVDSLCPRDRLLREYLTSPQVFRRGQEIAWIDPSAESAVLNQLQDGLRNEVASRNITVEVNPTSNLLTGDLGDLERHPLWRLMPPKSDGAWHSVSLCVGSDDPLTFNTDTRREFQAIDDTLTLAGISEDDARAWIDRVRRHGLDARFTVRSKCPDRFDRLPMLTPTFVVPPP